MAGPSPRLSGSGSSSIGGHLSGIAAEIWVWLGHAIDVPAVHEIEADQSGEGERAFSDPVTIRHCAASSSAHQA